MFSGFLTRLRDGRTRRFRCFGGGVGWGVGVGVGGGAGGWGVGGVWQMAVSAATTSEDLGGGFWRW